MANTVLVTGASGWLGRQIAAALLARRANVRLMLRAGVMHPRAGELASLTRAGADIVEADVSVPDSLSVAVDSVGVIGSVRRPHRGRRR